MEDSELNRRFPRKRKLLRKSTLSRFARNPLAFLRTARLPKAERTLQPIVAEEFRTESVTIFARRPMLITDLFIKSTRFVTSVDPATIEIRRAYRRQTEEFCRFEESNIACNVLFPEGIIQLSNLFMSEEFGLRLDLPDGNLFLINTDERPTDLFVVDGYFGRTLRAQAVAELVKVDE